MLYFSRFKMILIWVAVAITVILAAPNLFPASTLAQLPSWVPKRQMTLGLDLQGGSHILLEMNQNDLIKDRLETTRDEIRTLLRDAKIGYTGLAGTGRTLQVRITDPAQLDAAKKALKTLTDPVAAGLFSGGSIQEMSLDDSEPGLLKFTVTDAGIKYRTSTALAQSIEVVERRVNELGTTEPIVQRQGDDRILVQVPGLQDPQRLKEILGQTAKLTFQMVDQSMPVQDALKGRPPAGSVSDRKPRHRFGRKPRRRAGDLQFAEQRAGGLIPLRFEGRCPLRPGDLAECRQALRHHPRQPGDLGAADS